MTILDDRITTLTGQLQSQYRNSNVADLIEGILAIKKRFFLEAHNTLLSDCINLNTAKGDALDLWGYLLGVSRWYPLETTPEMRYNLWNFNNKKFYELNFWCPLNGHFEYLSDDEYRDILLYLLRKQNIYPNLKISNELVKEHFDKYGADLKIVDSREMEMIIEYDHSIMPHKLCYFLMLKDILHRPAGVGMKVEDKPAPPPPPSERLSYVIRIKRDDGATLRNLVVFGDDYLPQYLAEINDELDYDYPVSEERVTGINEFTNEPVDITIKTMITKNKGLYVTLWDEEHYQLFGVPDTEWGDVETLGEAVRSGEYINTGWLDGMKPTFTPAGQEVEFWPPGGNHFLNEFLTSHTLMILQYSYSQFVGQANLRYHRFQFSANGDDPVEHDEMVNELFYNQPWLLSDNQPGFWDSTEVGKGLNYAVWENLENGFNGMPGTVGVACFIQRNSDRTPGVPTPLPPNSMVRSFFDKPKEYTSFWDWYSEKYRHDNYLLLPRQEDIDFQVERFTRDEKRFRRSR